MDGSARLEVRVDLADERVVDSSPVRYETTGRGVTIGPPLAFETQVAGALAPFTQGLGPRAVRLLLVATRAGGEASPRWRVEGAATERPKGVEAAEPFTTRTDYRLLHEEIFRRWREDLHSAGTLAASFTVEQAALWVVGGWVARGAGAVLKLAGGPLVRVLGRGGSKAVGWLTGLLRRLPDAERKGLIRLWTKAEVQGIEALAATERAELRAAFLRLERLAATPLTKQEKKILRATARKHLWAHLEKLDSSLPAKLVNIDGTPYWVHHRSPLEYAHLAVESDINALSNLAAASKDVHDSIGRIWTVLRSRRPNPASAEVQHLVKVIDRQYGRWFNAPYDAILHQAPLAAAERAALAELSVLIP